MLGDVDGVTSSAIAYLYLRHLGVDKDNIVVLYHKGKMHGLKDVIGQINNDCLLLWMCDAGTNDVEECKKLYNKGIKILICDHHQNTINNPYATIINNQISPNVSNKHLSGVGVTFKFIQYCCMKQNDNYYQKLIDMVALGNLSDIMDMRELENRAFSKWGLSHITNPFLKELCKQRIRNNFEVTPTDIVWAITPLINSVQRSDNQELKKAVFDCFVCNRFDYDNIIEAMEKQHSKQSVETASMYDKLIKMVEPNNDKVMLIECENTPYTGLVANKLRDYYNKPVLLVHKENDEYIGSCRAYCDLLTPLNNSGLMTICAGHFNVFGVGWKVNDTDKLKAYLNTLDISEQLIDVSMVYERDLPYSLFLLPERYADIWSQNIPKPSVYFKIPIKDIDIVLLGKDKRTLKFGWRDMEFIKFRISNKDREIDGVYAEIIGTPSMNYWKGREKKQIIIDKWEIK